MNNLEILQVLKSAFAGNLSEKFGNCICEPLVVASRVKTAKMSVFSPENFEGR